MGHHDNDPDNVPEVRGSGHGTGVDPPVGDGGRARGNVPITCPMCTDAVEKRADRKIVALLVSAGVDVAGESEGGQGEFETLTPLFDDEGQEAPDGPTFTTDDLIEFHFLLEDDRYIQDFLTPR